MASLTPKQKLLAILAAKRGANPVITPIQTATVTNVDLNSISSPDKGRANDISITLQSGQVIHYNAEQKLAIDLAVKGYSIALTGPAGSGKTTTVRGILNALLASSRNQLLERSNHKHLPLSEVPGIVGVAFTNKAISNVQKNLPAELRGNFVTIHKLLEFGPVYYTEEDPVSGKTKTTMRFEPARHGGNPLPNGIYCLVIEEASMVDVPLWNMLIEALPRNKFTKLQVIFIGDIQQLPPVFGKSIYIHAMQKGIRTVELVHVYRQALESPIISLAHRILSGNIIKLTEFKEFSVDKSAEGKGKVTIHPWKKTLTDIGALRIISSWLPEAIDNDLYNPEVDMILTPFNKSFGTIAMNEIVAGHLAKKLNAEVWEIFTGINKFYCRIGERVLYNKSEARIIKIAKNGAYSGKQPRFPSTTMDYKGAEHDRNKLVNGQELTDEQIDEAMAQIDKMLEAMADHTSEDSPTSRMASHIITVKSEDTGVEYELRTAGEVSALLLGYAITVHKSQGSEYRKVFFLTHKSQSNMFYRELIYTAVTRAKEELYIICEPGFFVGGINSQRLPGANAVEKISNFDRFMAIESRNMKDGSDQIPIGLERFIGEREIAETELEAEAGN